MARHWSFWMTPLEHRQIRWLDDQYRGQLTAPGRAVLWGSVAAGTMLLGGLAPLMVAAFSFFVALLTVAVVTANFVRPKLRIERLPMPDVSSGEVVTCRISLENNGKRAARLVEIDERGLPAEVRPTGVPAMVQEVKPGERVEVTMQLRCERRGAYHLPNVAAASSFPSALYKIPRARSLPQRLVVFPAVAAVPSIELPIGRHYQPGGIQQASRVGDSMEILGIREWRTGDRLRDVHWPSTARMGKPVVREYQEEYFVRVAMLVDGLARNAREDGLFERAVSLAAGAATQLVERDRVVDVLFAGERVERIQAGRALAPIERVLEMLGTVDSSETPVLESAAGEILGESRSFSAVVFVAVTWDEARAAIVRSLEAEGLMVRVLCADDRKRPAGLGADVLVETP